MKLILVTGATGFIGKNLVNYLLKRNYKVRVLIRDKKKFQINNKNVEIYVGDITRIRDVTRALNGVYAAYYLVHSMSETLRFKEVEKLCAENFAQGCSENDVKRIIYLGGIIDFSRDMSTHLKSRGAVGDILRTSKSKVTELRASLIIGKGSASYKMIQLLVQKMPILILPKRSNTFCQPIALEDILYYLEGCLKKEETTGKTYEVGGTSALRYSDILKTYGNVIKKNIVIITVPFMSLTVLSFYVSVLTKQPFSLAMALMGSLKCKTVCQETSIRKVLPKRPLSYKEAILKSF